MSMPCDDESRESEGSMISAKHGAGQHWRRGKNMGVVLKGLKDIIVAKMETLATAVLVKI